MITCSERDSVGANFVMKIVPTISPETTARFWGYVAVGVEGTCWPWLGGIGGGGYGNFWMDGRTELAHRVAYLIANGAWPEPQGRHTCDNRPCCNPAHIIPGTHAENSADMVARGRAARQQGEKHGGARLTEAEVGHIRELRASGAGTTRQIATMFGVSPGHISGICSGKSWNHIC